MKLAALLLLLVPSLALAENHLMDNKQTVTYDCAKDASTNIMGNDNIVVLKGDCDTVNISGNGNKITGDHAKSLNISGNDNALALTVSATISLSGNRNAVSWKKASAKDPGPKVNSVGKDNKVTAVEPTK